MTVNTAISMAQALSLLDAETAAIGAGGELRFYSGTRPTTVDDPPTGVLLGRLSLANPAFAPAADNVTAASATANGLPLRGNAEASGQASWARVVTSDGTGIRDGNVGQSGLTDADFVLASVDFLQGEQFELSQWTVTLPLSQQFAIGADPGGADGAVQYRDGTLFNGFGSYNKTNDSVSWPTMRVTVGAAFDPSGLSCITLGADGAGGNGALVTGSRTNPGDPPFLAIGIWNSGSNSRNVYLGGGQWGTVDANRLLIFLDPDQNNLTANGGEPRGDFAGSVTHLNGPLNFIKRGEFSGQEAYVSTAGNYVLNNLAAGNLPAHGAEPLGTVLFSTTSDYALISTSASWEIVVTQEKMIAWNVTAGTKPDPATVAAGHIVFDFDTRRLNYADGLGAWKVVAEEPVVLLDLPEPPHQYQQGQVVWWERENQPVWWDGGRWMTFQHIEPVS